MQDRFKFRVFLKYNQIMCDIDSYCFLQGLNKCVFHFTNGGQKTLKNDDFILMQCTGLKDKNGKLIYEGDIVKMPYVEKILNYMPSDDNTELAKIEEFQGCYTIFYLDQTQRTYLYQWNKKIEVIGNIYQNPELLED